MVGFHFTLKGMFKGGNKTRLQTIKSLGFVMWQLLFLTAWRHLWKRGGTISSSVELFLSVCTVLKRASSYEFRKLPYTVRPCCLIIHFQTASSFPQCQVDSFPVVASSRVLGLGYQCGCFGPPHFGLAPYAWHSLERRAVSTRRA